MLHSTAHEELGGSEVRWQQAVDLEWDAIRSHRGRGSFLACATPGRDNARRLHDLAGGQHNVHGLYHRRDDMCFIAGLDAAALAAVASDERFTLSPLPHVAKLAPSMAMNYEAGATDTATTSGDGGRRQGGGGRNLRSLKESAFGDGVVPLPMRLLQQFRGGAVDGLVVTLAPGTRLAPAEAEATAAEWLADLQRHGGRRLRERHLWAREGLKEGVADVDAAADAKPGETADAAAAARGLREAGRTEAWRRLLTGLDGGGCDFSRVVPAAVPRGHQVILSFPAAATAAGAGISPSVSVPSGACLSALLAHLSTQQEVSYIEPRQRAFTFNLNAAWVAQSGTQDYWPLWDAGLNGTGQIIGVADTGVDISHCDFRESDGSSVAASSWSSPVTDLSRRKVVQYISFVDGYDAAGGHGTHVAGTLVGDNPAADINTYYPGGAFGAQLAVFDFGDSSTATNSLSVPDDVPLKMLTPAMDAGANVHSDSWGTLTNEYSDLDLTLDQFIYEHPRFLMVIAAGNCGDVGTSADCNGIGPEKSVISPALGKNVVAVGATENGGAAYDPDYVAYFSSRGPTPDGRIKPDVVAPGSTLFSALSASGKTCGWAEEQGTSMATPVVAAAATLAREYFVNGWYQTGLPNPAVSRFLLRG
ncbi:unnamed protein product [Phaeothamnion confervicola]